MVPFMVRNGGTQRWQLRLIGATRELLMPEGNPWQWGPAHSYCAAHLLDHGQLGECLLRSDSPI